MRFADIGARMFPTGVADLGAIVFLGWFATFAHMWRLAVSPTLTRGLFSGFADVGARVFLGGLAEIGTRVFLGGFADIGASMFPSGFANIGARILRGIRRHSCACV